MSDDDDMEEKPVLEGAPDWVVTFGDLMSLLLCFFVLLLSFSEMDRAKYKEVAGSLAKAFGVQRKNRTFQVPKGVRMVAKDFDQELVPTKEAHDFVVSEEVETIGEQIKENIEDNFKESGDMIEVEGQEDKMVIRLMGETAFSSGKTVLRPKMKEFLIKLAPLLKEQTTGDIVVAGHTDNVPVKTREFRSNLELSLSRAARVTHYLSSKAGVDPQRMAPMGFAEHRPIDTNDTPGGKERNRRVEIILTVLTISHGGVKHPALKELIKEK
ncbi:MAG: OmpA family protein [Desulfobacterales bacterium]|nr:OmpA family protein [Desulfobacterales bacterium]